MTDLLLAMLSKLTGAYTKNPDSMIGRLFSLFASALWDVENTLRGIALWRDIDNAQGRTLDRVGRNFGVARAEADDSFYRLLIKTKITALLSGGDVNTIIGAVSALFDIDPGRVEVVELFPAKCQIILDVSDVDPEYKNLSGSTISVMRRIIAGGVGKEILTKQTWEIILLTKQTWEEVMSAYSTWQNAYGAL